jgi:uncharacterized protein (DUF58 family)
MAETLLVILLFLSLLAAITQETFVVVLFYLFAGSYLVGRWWSGYSIKKISTRRIFTDKVFPEETVPVAIEIKNQSWLPAVWLKIQDLYPVDIADARTFHQVLSLGPHETVQLKYQLKPRKRGYYTVGPMSLNSGDLLGMSPDAVGEAPVSHLTVYPRVIPLRRPNLPSRSPMGTLPYHQPMFEDPSRPMGKRDYTNGDSLRRIDWKATASSGQLQVKLFEPSIALETALFLNLNQAEYYQKSVYDATELAIVVAASLASWSIANRQSSGLFTNGLDPYLEPSQEQTNYHTLPPHKGRAQLMHILEILARVKSHETSTLATLISHIRADLSWGTTVILITGTADQALFDEIIHARRSGLNPVLILCGRYTNTQSARSYARLAKVPVFAIQNEDDLKIWQK